MVKPAIVTVSDDAVIEDMLHRDLEGRFGRRFRILQQHVSELAVKRLADMKQREEPVALLIVDETLPGCAAVFACAAELFPEAKRVLLAAPGHEVRAVRALDELQADYFLPKPWDPADEHLHPVIQDLLDDWQATYWPPSAGIRVIGHRWSAASHLVKDFLGRNGVPFQWLDIEGAPEAKDLLASVGGDASRLPLILFPDDTRLEVPTEAAIAEKIGLETRTETKFYDLIIIGGGPAGLAAAVYGASEGLKTLLIERETPGGQAGLSSHIENYLGFPRGLTGADLARRAVTQARRFGAEILDTQEAVAVRADGPYRIIRLSDGTELRCHAVILATGVSWRTLDVPGVDRLTGAGIYYGTAVTEAASCQGADVFIIGGANSAGQAAVYLARFARSVTILILGDSLEAEMSRYLVDEIERAKNIAVRPHSQVVEVQGESQLEAIVIADTKTGERETVPAAALFIFIGAIPHTQWLEGIVARDEHGFVPSGPNLKQDATHPEGWSLDRDPFLLETNLPGVFVAGDARQGSIKRVASAVGEGSIAVQFVHQYLNNVH